MVNLVGDWGLYPWFPEMYEEMVEPSDIPRFRELQPYGKVFQCVGQDAEFLTLRYQKGDFRVRPGIFQRVPAPKFTFGTKVRLIDRPDVVGVVNEIRWHHQKQSEMYYLEVNGKTKSARYFSHELAAEQQ